MDFNDIIACFKWHLTDVSDRPIIGRYAIEYGLSNSFFDWPLPDYRRESRLSVERMLGGIMLD